ncbi:hypothetical protein BJ508DRAFT_244705 [Ascobolus immersus RN42]|uniref:NAD(P)-binding protein n=1 Tax=Ascobolus immersus RN42 TaxID=1160509 RepID=A0A3N4HEI9_ASCIM|nr:hypothetical protein BJ508DRAFT_244705 [Ascobolus immersus RN42]
MSRPTIAILGAGSNIGTAVASHFASLKFNVFAVSRTLHASSEGIHRLQADLIDPSQVTAIFDTIQTETGAGPHIVVYNAYGMTMNDPSAPGYPFNVPLDKFEHNYKANTLGAYVAMKEFTTLVPSLPAITSNSHPITPTFFMVGNILPWSPLGMGTTLGTGKAATAHLIMLGEKFGKTGARYYFGSEVLEDGAGVLVGPVNGKAHARFVEDLATKNIVKKEDWVENLRFFAKDGGEYEIYKGENYVWNF